LPIARNCLSCAIVPDWFVDELSLVKDAALTPVYAVNPVATGVVPWKASAAAKGSLPA